MSGKHANEFWYYAEGVETRGPVSFTELLGTLSRLPNPKGVLIWRAGFDDWKAVETVREVAEQIFRPPPINPRRPEAVERVALEVLSAKSEPGSSSKDAKSKHPVWGASWATAQKSERADMGKRSILSRSASNAMGNDTSNENAPERWLVVIGKIFRPIFLIGAAAVIWYGLSPSIGDRPLGSLTLSSLFLAAILAVITIFLMKRAFASASDAAAEIWGYLALLIVFGIAAFILYASRH